MSAPIQFPTVVRSTRADRSEMLAMLAVAVTLLREVKDPIGRAYREHAVKRMDAILKREDAR